MTESLKQKIFSLYESVGRQQAFFTKLLPDTLQEWSADYYLIYRMLDTIEDYAIENLDNENILKIARNDLFKALLKAAPIIKKSSGLPENYKNLFINIDDILNFHNTIDEEAALAIEKTGKIMAAGMAEFVVKLKNSRKAGSPHFIEDFKQLDEYCYIAAGCVGELNIEFFYLIPRYCFQIENPKTIINLISDINQIKESNSKFGAQLGNYVQIVNIIRDFAEDNNNSKKSYVPACLKELTNQKKILKIIEVAEFKEKKIQLINGNLYPSKIKTYLEVMFNIAKKHLDFYKKNIEIISKERIKPSFLTIFPILPAKLKFELLKYKLKKKFF